MSAITIKTFSPPCPSMKDAFLWCERQVSRLSGALPAGANKLKEILVRIGIVLSIAIPLLGLWAQRMHQQVATMTIPSQIASDKLIEDGYGDYIIRYRDNKTAQVDPDTFNAVSEIIDRFHVTSWMAEHPEATPSDRKAALLAEIHQIDDRLELVFVPKTLFELFFLKKSIEEDIEKVRQFSFQDSLHPTRMEENEVGNRCRGSENSWIQINPLINWGVHHNPSGRLVMQNNEKNAQITNRMKEVRSRLNSEFQNLLQKFDSALKMDEIEHLLEEQISFIQNIDFVKFSHCEDPSPASQFSTDNSRGKVKGMKLSDESITQVLRHAIRLECAEEAQGKILLYRGGNIERDTPLAGKTTNYSLSYGVSLFAGIINDAGATAFHYMRTRHLDAYAFYIDPKNENDRQIFFTPKATLTSLFEKGEFFHSRTKAFQSAPGDAVLGYMGAMAISYERFPHKSDLQRDRLVALFKDKMNHSYLLKRAIPLE